MSAANFDYALAQVLEHERGYVNHPKDPGGATNRGVTQAVYDDWRRDHKMNPRSVRYITSNEVSLIYRKQYWDKIKGDALTSGLDYCVFDFAVNSGVNRASRYLQRAVGAVEDGAIGPKTIAAARAIPPAVVIDRICDARLNFLHSLATFATFGKGWTRRVADVRSLAKALA